MRAILLPGRAVLRVSGEDATKFLNGIVTSSVDKLTPGEAAFTALLTPQGKIVVDFFVVAVPADEGSGFVLDLPEVLAQELLAKLNLYKLRAKVELAVRPDLAVAAAIDKLPPDELGLAYADPRHSGMGWRVVLPAEGAEAALRETGMTIERPELWQGRRIVLGIPEGGKDFLYGDTFPHEADMDALHGVDFQKGCFIGQEVVSRVQRRDDGPRKRIVPVAFENAPASGAEIKVGDKPAGFMGSSAGRLGLAMLRLDRVQEGLQQGGDVIAGNIKLTLLKPDWMPFDVPGAKASAF
jgi:folate-binding protein YgfZ